MLTNIEKRLRHLWNLYGSLNNIVMAVALLIAAGWAWGAISMMQTNFEAQKNVDSLGRDLELTKLQVQTLELQKSYYDSDEYKDLAAREDLGLASKGEKVLLLPPNSEAVKRADATAEKTSTRSASTGTASRESNFEQWIDFLSGRSAQGLQK